jgi:hypothetical protein
MDMIKLGGVYTNVWGELGGIQGVLINFTAKDKIKNMHFILKTQPIKMVFIGLKMAQKMCYTKVAHCGLY